MVTQHLLIERLAELADNEPLAPEREHLLVCASCRAELAAYRSVVAMAADERRRIAPPLTHWELLSTALKDEGVMGPGVSRQAQRGGRVVAWATRVAASVLLVGSGAVAGRMSAGMPVSAAFAFGVPGRVAPSDASGGLLALNAEAFASASDALTALRSAQDAYTRAASYLATHDTSSSDLAQEQYRTRLAALDRGAETFRQALDEAPEDPIINQYYLATLGSREATLSRLGTVLPVGARLSRF